ncbi:MAG: sugar transferase [Clostridia bacterium]|nr:sugar transferase [Clostridia bacterium]
MEARRFRKSIMFLCRALIIAALAAVFYVTYIRHYNVQVFYYKGNLLVTLLYTFLLVLLMSTYGGFKIGVYRLQELIFSGVLASFIADFVMYFVFCMIARKMLTPWPQCVAFLIQCALLVPLFIFAHRIHMCVYPPVDMLVLRAGTAHETEIIEKFEGKGTRQQIAAELLLTPELDWREAAAPYAALLLGEIDTATRCDIMAYCFEHGKQCLMMPSMQDILLNNATQFMATDSLLYSCRNRSFTPDQLMLKRMMDIVLSALILLITSPLTLATALIIKLQDGGPVFYRQERLTRNGERFMLVKFRSMIVDAEKETGAVLAGKADKRITPFGHFIRAARIDELPQLFNILKGEMSLVGPRPERPELFHEICREFPQFAYRLRVKAGLTGYAQLYGRYNTSFEDKARLDLLYIERVSVLQDLQLLFFTVKIIFMKESTEGVRENKEQEEDVAARSIQP